MTDTKHETTAPRNKGGRPRKGTLEYRKGSWHARLTVTVDGESTRRWFNLETQNRAVASRKMARLLRDGTSAPSLKVVREEAAREETYAELSARVSELRRKDGVRDVGSEDRRDRLYIIPTLGPLPMSEVTSDAITALLQELRDQGKAQSTIRHAVHVLRTRFEQARLERTISENPLDFIQIPKGKVDRRERAVLMDHELARYLAWQHPEEFHQLAVLQRQTMACLSRMFGGLRTGDLHALKWESLDATGGSFQFGWAPRKKTSRPQKLIIPEMLRPILHDWWERQGRPTSGLVFPLLRGKRAGVGERGEVSHARAFRRDLKRAFGLEVPVLGTKRNPDGSEDTYVSAWEDSGREMTPPPVSGKLPPELT